MNISISKWLAIALGVSVSSLVIVGAGGLYQLNRAEQRFEYFQKSVTQSVDDLNSAISNIGKNRLLLFRWINQTNPERKSSIARQMIENLESARSALDKYEREDATDATDKALLEKERAALTVFADGQEDFMTAYTHDNANAIMERLEDGGSLRNASLAVEREVQQHISYNIQRGDALRHENQTAYERSFITLIGVILLSSIFSGGLALRLQRSIVRSLRNMKSALEHARSNLDLTQRVSIARMDEVGHTAQAFNDLQANFGKVIGAVRSAADAVRMASHEISSGNADLSVRTEQQAASLEETAASMAQITQTVKQNADNARHADVLAGGASNLAADGNRAVNAMLESIEQISQSAGKISEITAVIEGIAFQTNILALNAAVEAARAGEEGRGFAVVAGEVRSLAQRCSHAAKEIKSLIEASVTTVRDGAAQAREVGATVTEVKQAIEQVSTIVGEIAAASSEQQTGIEQICQAVSQMDQVTQQNAALVEQAAAAALSLDEQAESLTSSVSVFKVATVQSIQ
ncbi:methyl-accepting chemotaxis protein [Burkholderia sp. THE68]|uniref:methyl-accepting chemotaxis protein n=1 Tax=Burkholderia sp. THE68 TaxID=758782 RepID=UPI001E2DE497|nr:methyl-accepting chemotaxis protein [Burkholderia sp. THE68]